MYAIIQTGGKQYRVGPGDLLQVEKVPGEKGGEIRFEQVLLVGGEATKVGTPFVPQAFVIGEIESQGQGEKIVVYRYKKRKGYDKKQGHRQKLTTVRIKEIKA